MIRYTLKCENKHIFESWFANADAFNTLNGRNTIQCTTCGSTDVEKTLMAPRVSTSGDVKRGAGQAADADAHHAHDDTSPVSLTQPQTDMQKALQELRTHIEQNSQYVGMQFAKQARAMHDGDAPEKPIYGEVKPEDAKSLIEDGISVTPLPFIPARRTN